MKTITPRSPFPPGVVMEAQFDCASGADGTVGTSQHEDRFHSPTRNVVPFPQPLASPRLATLACMVAKLSEEVPMPLAEVHERVAAVAADEGLGLAIRQRLWVIQSDLHGILSSYDAQNPAQCTVTEMQLRATLDDIIDLQNVPRSEVPTFRLLNATLLHVGLQITRILGINLRCADQGPISELPPQGPTLRKKESFSTGDRHRTGFYAL